MIALSAASGWLAWHGPMWVGLAVLPLLLWCFVSTRAGAFGIALAYYIPTEWALYSTLNSYFHGENPAIAALSVFSLVLVLSAPWALLWRRRPAPWRVAALLLILTVPPVGLLHLWSPLFGLAAWLPGFGLAGLLIFGCGLACLARWPAAAASGLAAFVVLAHVLETPVSAPEGWRAFDTRLASGGYNNQAPVITDLEQHQRIIAMIDTASRGADRVLVWPETYLVEADDRRMSFFDRHWAELAGEGKTVLAGYVTAEPGAPRANILAARGSSSFDWVQRFPAAGSMWRPWDAANHYPMRLGGAQTQVIDGRKTTLAVCYEAALLWPLLRSQFDGATAYIASGNLSWGRAADLSRQGRAVVHAWARLAGLPYVVAINE